MAKTRVIRVRISEAELEKLKRLKGDKNISQSIRELIIKGCKAEEQEIKETASLISKLENADLLKIAEKTDVILKKLSSQNGDEVNEIFKKFEQEIGILRTVIAVVALGLPAPSKDLERHMPAIYKKLKSALGRE